MINWFVLSLYFIISFSNAFACKVDTTFRDSVDKNPLLAKTAVIGIVKEEDGNKFFKVEFNWDPILPQIPIDTMSLCAPLGIETGKKYLLLSGIRFNDPQKKYEIIKTSLLIELSKAKSMMTKLAERKMNVSGQINPSWRFCEKDNECVKVKNLCKGSESVNGKFKINYNNYVKNIKTNKECESQENKIVENRCVNYFCQ